MANDFRSYLQTVDPYAYQYTGNDGKIDLGKVGKGGDTAQFSTTDPNQIQSYVTGLYNKYINQSPANIGSIYGGSTGAPPPVYAPKLDIASTFSQARSQAEGAVNPFYTKQLNDFLAQQAAQKQQTETQTATNIKNYQDTLQQALDANAVTGARTTEDTALKQSNINTANDQNQVDTGTAFENQRLADATKLATGGVIGTGAGNRATGVATADRNTTEGRQNDAFQQSRDQAELFKNRTFEDLTTSSKNATGAEAKSENQANFDLQSFIQNQGFQEQTQRNDLEQKRLQAVASEQQNRAKIIFNNYLAGIKNPAQYAAAVNTYGGSF